MRPRSIICTLAILLLGFTTAGTHAADKEAQIEEIVAGMESLFMELLGTSDIEPVFEDHGNGIYSLSVPLDQLDRGNKLIAPASVAKDVTNLHHGHMRTEPDDFGVLIHAALATLDSAYNLWWVAVNLGGSDVTLKTTWSHKGPGADTKDNDQLTYPASAIQLTWIADVVHEASGVFKSFVKISGAANSKTKGGCFAE